MNFNIPKSFGLLVYFIGMAISLWTFNSRGQTNSNNLYQESTTELNQSIIWSELPTNGIKAGIYVERFNALNGMSVRYLVSNNAPIEFHLDSTLSVRFIPAFVGIYTNHVMMFLAPQKSWKVDLQSSTGEPIPKTKLGRQWGKAMTMKIGSSGPQDSGFSVFIFDSHFSLLPQLMAKDIKITELFDLKQPGDYTLKITFCGMIATNNQFSPIYFAPVSIKLKITD